MRGKVVAMTVNANSNGITPAYAGKRPTFRILFTLRRDHPRVCGEKEASPIGRLSSLGSPPRMRGKGDGAGYRLLQIGITPAYAGKSASSLVPLHRVGNHPRVCGEKWRGVYVFHA